MKQESLVAAVPRRRRYGSYMGEIGPAPENLLQRDFSATAPNQKWLTDISEFQLPEGKVYLSPMIGRLKTEWFYARDWRATTIKQFTQALDAYIRWYNEQRIKISLGARSPVEYRRALGIAA